MILNWEQGILNVCQDKLNQQQQVAVDERGDYDAVLYTGTRDYNFMKTLWLAILAKDLLLNLTYIISYLPNFLRISLP